MSLECGQVLWLIMPFNNSGDVASVPHPYIVYRINRDLNVCELIQLDSLAGKMHKALMKSNKLVMNTGPDETVILKPGFAQLDNTMQVELFDGLESFRHTTDRLSGVKFDAVSKAYKTYHAEHQIDEDKIVYVSADRLMKLNGK